MTIQYRGLRGSIHPIDAQRRLDYWQGIDRSRAADAASREMTGEVGPEANFDYGSVDYAFDRLIDAQIRFAKAQIRQSTKRPSEQAASVNETDRPSDRTADPARPVQ